MAIPGKGDNFEVVPDAFVTHLLDQQWAQLMEWYTDLTGRDKAMLGILLRRSHRDAPLSCAEMDILQQLATVAMNELASRFLRKVRNDGDLHPDSDV